MLLQRPIVSEILLCLFNSGIYQKYNDGFWQNTLWCTRIWGKQENWKAGIGFKSSRVEEQDLDGSFDVYIENLSVSDRLFSIKTMLLEDVSSIHDFDIGVTLGTGSFGRVRFATHRANKSQHFAIKILKKSEIIRFQQVCSNFDPCLFTVNVYIIFMHHRLII